MDPVTNPAAGTPAASTQTPAPAPAPAAAGAPAPGKRPDYVPQGFRGSTDGQPVAAPAPAPAAAAEPPKPKVPERPVAGHGGLIPPERISERVDRERKKILKAEYGTDDPVAVARIKKERADRDARFAELAQQEEERKRQAMTEQQRIQADLDAEKARTAELQEQLAQMREEGAYKEQDAIINAAAAKHVAPTSLEYAKFKLTAHLKTLTPAELTQFGPKQLDRWFSKFVVEEPSHKLTTPADPAEAAAMEEARKKAEAAAAAAKKPVPKRQPITTTAKPAAGPPAPAASTVDTLGGKTAKPGQPNTMNKQEYRVYKRNLGFHS